MGEPGLIASALDGAAKPFDFTFGIGSAGFFYRAYVHARLQYVSLASTESGRSSQTH